MTPVALWTGRLPGLRPLPRKGALALTGLIATVGAVGAFGGLGPSGPYFAVLGSLASGWTVWRHRWPTELPMRLKASESPQGPDERAAMMEIRHEGDLLGWDVGILWFEKGGVGFVGRTVSFVIPRALMHMAPAPHTVQALLRAPQMTAKVFETTVGIVPLEGELRAQTTLARIDVLPETITSETILPPTTMHPDLLQRGLAVRRRVPILMALSGVVGVAGFMPSTFGIPTGKAHAFCIVVFVLMTLLGSVLPASIRARLPKER